MIIIYEEYISGSTATLVGLQERDVVRYIHKPYNFIPTEAYFIVVEMWYDSLQVRIVSVIHLIEILSPSIFVQLATIDFLFSMVITRNGLSIQDLCHDNFKRNVKGD